MAPDARECVEGETREGGVCEECGTQEEVCSGGVWVEGDCDRSACSEPCDAPGTTETTSCGLCGTLDRFCTAEGVWENVSECEGEGECEPGTVTDLACGMCGTQSARCTAECVFETVEACMGESGVCSPGEVRYLTSGCPAGERRVATCRDTCESFARGPCEPSPIELVLVIEDRARQFFTGLMDRDLLRTLPRDLQAIRPGSRVATVIFDDFPSEPFGTPPGGRFSESQLALVKPLNDPDPSAGVPLFPARGALGDEANAGVQALGLVAGLPAHPETIVNAISPACPAELLEGEGPLCWTPGSLRYAIIIPRNRTYNAPDGLEDYGGGGTIRPILGAVPHTWNEVRDRWSAAGISAHGILLFGNAGVLADWRGVFDGLGAGPGALRELSPSVTGDVIAGQVSEIVDEMAGTMSRPSKATRMATAKWLGNGIALWFLWIVSGGEDRKIRRWLNLAARVLLEPERRIPEAHGRELRTLRRQHRRRDRRPFQSD